jgi:hypothetical protein
MIAVIIKALVWASVCVFILVARNQEIKARQKRIKDAQIPKFPDIKVREISHEEWTKAVRNMVSK